MRIEESQFETCEPDVAVVVRQRLYLYNGRLDEVLRIMRRAGRKGIWLKEGIGVGFPACDLLGGSGGLNGCERW